MGGLVGRQLEAALKAARTGDQQLAESVIEKDGLIDNLNLRVEAASFEATAEHNLTEAQQRAVRSALKVAINLEHAGDAAADIARHVRIMRQEKLLPVDHDFGLLGSLAPRALHDAVRAYLTQDLDLAKHACEREPELDQLYVEHLMTVRKGLAKNPERAAYYLHLLALLKYFEKVGDYVLNIGEQAIFLTTGRRLKFTQFQQLDTMLGEHSAESGFAPFLDGLSGAVVARVGNGVPMLYKEGTPSKIAAEVEKSAAWREIDPDLIPKVLSTTTQEDRQALLREWVDGSLLSDLLFESKLTAEHSGIIRRLCDTLTTLWAKTLTPQPPEPAFVKQISDRLPEVLALHPELEHLAESPVSFRGGTAEPLSRQLRRLRLPERRLAPPFSVWLHGDLNPNNVVYNTKDGSLKFIDIHRSRFGDYLQDVTVFLVGLERQPDLAPSVRREMESLAAVITGHARDFARDSGDETFELRLQLGLGRSYLTSARIILQPDHAEWLFRRGRVCLQRVIDGLAAQPAPARAKQAAPR
jgi:phosphate uptake regulator